MAILTVAMLAAAILAAAVLAAAILTVATLTTTAIGTVAILAAAILTVAILTMSGARAQRLAHRRRHPMALRGHCARHNAAGDAAARRERYLGGAGADYLLTWY